MDHRIGQFRICMLLKRSFTISRMWWMWHDRIKEYPEPIVAAAEDFQADFWAAYHHHYAQLAPMF